MGTGRHPADFLALCQARAACCVQEIFNILCLKERAWKGSKTILNTSAGSYTDGNWAGAGRGEGAVCKNNPCRSSRAHSIHRAQVVSSWKSPFLPPVVHAYSKLVCSIRSVFRLYDPRKKVGKVILVARRGLVGLL